jgi:hypothetical protein
MLQESLQTWLQGWKGRTMYLRQRFPIRVIARPKRSLAGDHWGVQLPNGQVIHLMPEGVSLHTFDAFVRGFENNWKVVRAVDPVREPEINARVAEALRQGVEYRLHDQNCEVFANWLVGDPPVSPQVQGVLILGAFALLLGAAAR